MLLWFESNGPHRHMRVALPDSELARARRQLRASLRARRRAVAPEERARLSRLIARHAARAFRLRPGLRVALFASLPEELDTGPLLALALARGCEVYLPVIADRRRRRLEFRRLTGRMRSGPLGISEPHGGEALGARWLELVFVPLVGFDARGMRLGMGAGYYDRAFAFRRLRDVWRGPRLVGLAYSFQEVPHLDAAPHDVLLDAVVTERGVVACATGC